MYVCGWMDVQMPKKARKGQSREVGAVVSHSIWMLRIKLKSSGRATGTLNDGTILLRICVIFLKSYMYTFLKYTI